MKLYDYQNDLVNKTREALLDGYKAPCIVAPCGAGKSVMIASVAKQTTDKNNHVLFLVHRRELIDQIRETFKNFGVNISLVKFGMVQTIVNKLGKIDKPQLIITDENHHALAKSYKKIYEYYEGVPRIGFTATPIRLNGSGLGDVNDKLIETVDVDWLIENKRLAPFDYYAPSIIDRNELKMSSTRDFTNKSMDKALDKAIYGDVIKYYRRLAEGQQAIAYCHSIESSKKTAELFNNNNISACHIDAKTPKGKRDEIINKFRNGEIKILCNVDLIGEGFDVPDCSVVIMLRPTKSLSLFIQQSMRGMRYKENKRSVIIDHVGNVAEFGLPNQKRNWSLKTKKIRKKDSDTFPITTCPECFATYKATSSLICPFCGFKRVVETKEMDVDDKAELKKLDSNFKVVVDTRNPEDCKTMGELYELAKNRGYKPGWAYIWGKKINLIH